MCARLPRWHRWWASRPSCSRPGRRAADRSARSSGTRPSPATRTWRPSGRGPEAARSCTRRGAPPRRPNGGRSSTPSTSCGPPPMSPTHSASSRARSMKLGQMASYLDDGLPEPMRDALASLQQDAPPMAPELSAQIVREQLGDVPERLFARMGPEPGRGGIDRAGAPRGDALRAGRRGQGAVPGDRRGDPRRPPEHRPDLSRARVDVPRIRARPAGRGAARPARRRARLRDRGRQPTSLLRLVRGSPVHPRPARDRRALDGPRPHHRVRRRRALRRGRDVVAGRAQCRGRVDLPVRVPQHLSAARVQRRPASGQLPVPRRRPGELSRLRPRQALHARRGAALPVAHRDAWSSTATYPSSAASWKRTTC